MRAAVRVCSSRRKSVPRLTCLLQPFPLTTENPKLCAIEAKNLIRCRRSIEKFTELKTRACATHPATQSPPVAHFLTASSNNPADLMSIEMQMATMSATLSLKTGMQNALKAMCDMNKRVKSDTFQTVIREFARESGMMEQIQDMMNEGLDGAFEAEGDSEAEAAMIQQVMQEVVRGCCCVCACDALQGSSHHFFYFRYRRTRARQRPPQRTC